MSAVGFCYNQLADRPAGTIRSDGFRSPGTTHTPIDIASSLIGKIGFEPVVIGGLAMGKYLVPGTPLDQWYGADYRYVKIKDNDGGLYILRFDEALNEWALIMFVSARGQDDSAL
jgi:hypothetical protein